MNQTTESNKIRLTDDRYIAHTYARFPLVITGGHGSLLTDDKGKDYIDLGSGIAVNTFGLTDPVWIEAVTKQLNKIAHTSNLYYTAPDTELAELLCTRTGMKKVFFSNSGAEANECAIKAARKYAQDKRGRDCYHIITLKNSFHGRTITTLAATGQDVFHQQFTPMTEGFLYAEANQIQSVIALAEAHKTAAILMECVQGEGGVLTLEPDFVKAVAAYAAEHDLLLMIDEVQTGNGRSGALYSYMNYGITPDIVTTAKGIGGGLPLGVTMLGEKVDAVFAPGQHGSTFGGNPVVCAGAVSILNRIDDSLLKEVRQKSALIFDSFTGAKGVVSVSGMGLMIGIETVRPAKEILAACMERGVLLLTAKNKLRLLPALNIPETLLCKAIDIIKEECAKECDAQ